MNLNDEITKILRTSKTKLEAGKRIEYLITENKNEEQTLDYFAGLAMQAYLKECIIGGHADISDLQMSKQSYSLANQMLEVKKAGPKLWNYEDE